jgi:transcriptional regulator GlxA family with amidase domain
MKRVKQIRLSMAWGLVMFSDLKMTDIAQRVGYGRLHEFSRDYRRQFGRSPLHDRIAERSTVGGGNNGKSA